MFLWYHSLLIELILIWQVIGVPVTLNGDLKNQFVETNVGFDTICKVLVNWCWSFTWKWSVVITIMFSEEVTYKKEQKKRFPEEALISLVHN